MEEITLFFDADDVQRVDAFVSSQLDLTRSHVSKLLAGGNITVNKKTVQKSAKLKRGDEVLVILPEPEPLDVLPENIPLDIVYEDDYLLVVNKPKGMVVHPAAGNYTGTLVNALLWHCKDNLSGINGVMRPGIVHRIDKDTSGLLMVAKNDIAHNFLSEQIKEHSFVREYEAVVHGVIKQDTGRIEAPIGRHPVKRKQMAVTAENSKPAITHFSVINRFEKFTHIRLKLETGRTHQIRVHMSYLGYAVAGDSVYGPKKCIESLGGQCLHAKKLGFIHPKTRQYMEFETPLPEYFTKFLETIK